MGQILKLANGDKVQNRRNEEVQLEQNLTELQSLYAGLDATKRAQIDALTAKEQEVLTNNNLSSRDERRFRLDMSKRKLALIKGTSVYNPVSTGTVLTNRFGFLTRDEINTLGNAVAKSVLSTPQTATAAWTVGPDPAIPESDVSTPPIPAPGAGDKRMTYNWRNPEFDTMLPNTDVKSRVKMLASGLLSQLQQMNEVYTFNTTNPGRGVVYGFHGDIPEVYNKKYQLLSNLVRDLDDPNSKITDQMAFERINKIIADGSLEVNSDGFKDIFKEYYEQPDETAVTDPLVAAETLLPEKYKTYTDFGEYLKKGKYKIKTYKGLDYVVDEKGNPVTTPYSWINDDYQSSTFNTGLFVTDDGKIWLGDVTTITDPQSKLYGQYHGAIDPERSDNLYHLNDDLYTSITLGENDMLDDIEENKLLQKVIDKHPGMHYYDVSNYFRGNEPVIAVKTDGKEVEVTPYGTPKLIGDNNIKYYTIDENGNLKEYTDLSSYNYKGYGEQVAGHNVIELSDEWLTMIPVFTDNDHMSNKNWWTQMWDDYDTRRQNDTMTVYQNGVLREAPASINYSREYISEHPDVWINDILTAIEKIDTGNALSLTELERGLLQNFGLDGSNKNDISKLDGIVGLLQIIKKYSNDPKVQELIQQHAATIKSLKQEFTRLNNDRIASQKNGGVIYAKKGTKTEALKEDEKKPSVWEKMDASNEEAQAHGYRSGMAYEVANQKLSDAGLSAEDKIRLGAMATDLISAGVGFVPTGWGQAAAAVGGLGSTAANLAADIMDESTDTKQTFINLGTNLGLAALQLVPGAGSAAKTMRVLKGLGKIAPRVLTAANAVGLVMDEDNRKSWEKVINGQFKQITRDDLKNLSWTLSSIAGATKGAQRKYHTDIKGRKTWYKKSDNDKTVSNLVKGEYKGLGYKLTDKSGNDLIVDEAQFKTLLGFLKKGDDKGAQKYLQSLRKGEGADFELTKKRSLGDRARSLVGKSAKGETEYEIDSKDIDLIDRGENWKNRMMLDISEKDNPDKLDGAQQFYLKNLLGINPIWGNAKTFEKRYNKGDVYGATVGATTEKGSTTTATEYLKQLNEQVKSTPNLMIGTPSTTSGKKYEIDDESLAHLAKIIKYRTRKDGSYKSVDTRRLRLYIEKNGIEANLITDSTKRDALQALRKAGKFQSGGSIDRLQQFIKSK